MNNNGVLENAYDGFSASHHDWHNNNAVISSIVAWHGNLKLNTKTSMISISMLEPRLESEPGFEANLSQVHNNIIENSTVTVGTDP